MRRIAALIMAGALALAACNQADQPELTTTTTTVPASTTTAPASTTTRPDADTTTTLAGQVVDEYDVVVRSSVDEGEVLWVVIPPGGYTELDLEGFVARLRDETDGLWELHVFDDPAALEAARVEADLRTDEEQALVDEHRLVSLLEGSVVSFGGPYEDAGEYVLGS